MFLNPVVVNKKSDAFSFFLLSATLSDEYILLLIFSKSYVISMKNLKVLYKMERKLDVGPL